MPIAKKIETLTVGDKVLNVADMSEQVQSLVSVFDEWNQKEADARDNLHMIQYAKSELSRKIMDTINLETAEAAGTSTDAGAADA